MAISLLFRRQVWRSRGYFPPFQVWGAVHGTLVTLSGVLFWVGVWDILDFAILPRPWWWRVAAVVVGLAGMYATGTLWVAQSEPKSRSFTRMTQLDKDSSSDEEVDTNDLASGEGPARFFRRPRFRWSLFCKYFLAQLSAVTAWTGLWDLLDQFALPALAESCAFRTAGPGRLEFGRAGPCVMIKVVVVALGTMGLHITGTLYNIEETDGIGRPGAGGPGGGALRVGGAGPGSHFAPASMGRHHHAKLQGLNYAGNGEGRSGGGRDGIDAV